MRNSQRDIIVLLTLSVGVIVGSLLHVNPLLTLAGILLMPIVIVVWYRHREEERTGRIRLSPRQRNLLIGLLHADDEHSARYRVGEWFPGASQAAVEAAVQECAAGLASSTRETKRRTPRFAELPTTLKVEIGGAAVMAGGTLLVLISGVMRGDLNVSWLLLSGVLTIVVAVTAQAEYRRYTHSQHTDVRTDKST